MQGYNVRIVMNIDTLELKTWMEQNGKNVTDVAYMIQIHPNTIYRFLQGKPVLRSTKRALALLVAETPILQAENNQQVAAV